MTFLHVERFKDAKELFYAESSVYDLPNTGKGKVSFSPCPAGGAWKLKVKAGMTDGWVP